MQLPHLTIAEAAEKTGRSESTIRRVIRTIAEDKSSPDRAGVFPEPKEVDAFKKKGENFTWKICEDVLLKNLKRVQAEEKKSASSGPSFPPPDVLSILQNELKIKNQQIEKQWDVITSLNERLREGNILMATLQKQLALPEVAASQSPAEPVIVEASVEPVRKASRKAPKKASAQASTEASVTPSMAASMEPSKKPSKKGILAWMWR